jgi:uncharacterized protein
MKTYIKHKTYYIPQQAALYIVLLGSLLWNTFLHGQEHKIHVKAFHAKDSVLLRWAPSTPQAWQALNRYGVTLERHTIIVSPTDSSVQIIKKVFPDTIKPAPPQAWESIIETDNHAAGAAAAIYADDFTMTTPVNIVEAYQQEQVSKNRFGIALFCADQSFTAALLSGLAFSDTTTSQQERYLYQVSPCIPRDTLTVDTGFVYAEHSIMQQLPQIPHPEVVTEPGLAKIRWDDHVAPFYYSSVSIERARDSAAGFQQVNDAPVVVFDKHYPYDQPFYYYDTLSQPGDVYFYRIQGRSFFGMDGPYSDTVRVVCPLPVIKAPKIVDTKNICSSDSLMLHWEFNSVHEQYVYGFRVCLSWSDTARSAVISDSLLPPHERSFLCRPGRYASYYSVEALLTDSSRIQSMKHMALVPDTIPPHPPENPAGDIDTTGIVKLNWQPGPGEKSYGFHIFRANNPNDEFSLISHQVIKKTQYTDTIVVKTLTRDIFYKIKAVDNFYNHSGFSETLRLRKPDIIPPSAPAVMHLQNKDTCVTISWRKSFSKDVHTHVVERYISGTGICDTLMQVLRPDTVNTFSDCPPRQGLRYDYTIVAIDSSGNRGAARPVSVRTYAGSSGLPFTDISATANRQLKYIALTWKQKRSDIDRIFIFRKQEKGRYRLYSQITGQNNKFTDYDLVINTTYYYKLQAQFSNGACSVFSSPAKTDY